MSYWSERVIGEFKRDWKRTSLLVLLTLVVVVLVVRQFTGEPDQAQARASIGSRPNARQHAGGDADHPAGHEVASPGDSPSREHVLAGMPDLNRVVLRRDPFVVDPNRFPPDPAAAKKADESVKVSQLEQQAEEERQAAEAIIKAEAAKLKLQSILMADPPRAMIGRDVVRVGQRVVVSDPSRPFVVTRISRTSVALEREGFEVVLTLE